MQAVQINQLFTCVAEQCICIITKITPKTITLKPCICIAEHVFDNDVIFETNEPTIYKTFLPMADPNASETRILKRLFNYERINYDIVGRVYCNDHLKPESVADCEAFCNTERLALKHKIRNTLSCLYNDRGGNDTHTKKLKLDAILKLRDEYQAQPELYFVLMSEISLPDRNYLNLFRDNLTPANLARLGFNL